jgi:hypothetical protein
MGRRTAWVNESHSIEEKLVEIVSRADYRGLRFGDIVDLAKDDGISRPSVARHLRILVKGGILKKDGGYRLAMEAINWKHSQRSVFSVLSMHLFDDIFEKAGQGILSNSEFVELFTRRVGILALYTILVGLEKASKNSPKEGGRWIEEAFGNLVQKDGWRMCVDRQIFGEIVTLKTPILLEQPLRPKIEVEDGTIYVYSPESIKRGTAGRVLRELSKPIPPDRLERLKKCLKDLYPAETELLDDAINLIMTAAAQSKGR